MSRLLSNTLIVIALGVLGLVWALVTSAVFQPSARSGCAMMMGGIVLILIIMGLIVWLVRFLMNV